MWSTTALLSLLAAASSPVALAAPIPSSLSADWEHRFAAAAGRISLRVHALTPEAAAALADENGSSTTVIDNHHYVPSGDVPPTAVLANHRPIVTTYLMGLASSKAHGSASRTSMDKPIPVRVFDTHKGVEVVIIDADVEATLEATKAIAGTPDSIPILAPTTNRELTSTENGSPSTNIPETLQMESQPLRQKARPSGLPCHYAQLRHDYNDMMVISLVAVFLLVIVVVELWESAMEQTAAPDAPVGVISLADDSISEKQPLSVQAAPMAVPPEHQADLETRDS